MERKGSKRARLSESDTPSGDDGYSSDSESCSDQDERVPVVINTKDFRYASDVHAKLLEAEKRFVREKPGARRWVRDFLQWLDLPLHLYDDPEHVFNMSEMALLENPKPPLVVMLAEELQRARKPDYTAPICTGRCLLTMHAPRIDHVCSCPQPPRRPRRRVRARRQASCV